MRSSSFTRYYLIVTTKYRSFETFPTLASEDLDADLRKFSNTKYSDVYYIFR
jgi:hypothetical protein